MPLCALESGPITSTSAILHGASTTSGRRSGEGLRDNGSAEGAIASWLRGPDIRHRRPGGGGKVPISPQYILTMGEGTVIVRNYEGVIAAYREATYDPREKYDESGLCKLLRKVPRWLEEGWHPCCPGNARALSPSAPTGLRGGRATKGLLDLFEKGGDFPGPCGFGA